jgi:hemoglobin
VADDDDLTIFERVGGEPFFERLVDEFYDGVATDPVLLPLYPEQHDLTGARHRLTLFLVQYWGGPTTYSDERGHPRLRMRHMDFRIDAAARDRWLSLMHDAMVEQDLAEEQETQLWMYLVSAAFAMQNVPDEPYGQPLPTKDA